MCLGAWLLCLVVAMATDFSQNFLFLAFYLNIFLHSDLSNTHKRMETC